MTAEAYFEHSSSLITDLRQLGFDVGVGGLNLADSLLFKELELPYVKLSEEDVEAFQLQVRL